MEVIFESEIDFTHTMLGAVVSKNDLRPAINGVYIDVKNSCLVCTDMHIILEYPILIKNNNWEGLDGKIVPLELFHKMKYMGNYKHFVFPLEYRLEKDFAKVYCGPLEVFKCEYIEGTYPDYRTIYPDNLEEIEPEQGIGLSLSYLSNISTALPKDGLGKRAKFFIGERTHGVYFETLETYQIRPIKGVIMPVRYE